MKKERAMQIKTPTGWKVAGEVPGMGRIRKWINNVELIA